MLRLCLYDVTMRFVRDLHEYVGQDQEFQQFKITPFTLSCKFFSFHASLFFLFGTQKYLRVDTLCRTSALELWYYPEGSRVCTT